MQVVTSYSNFSRARIDHDMQGRFDLPIYQTGVDGCDNFITNFKGNAIYRSGFEDLIAFQDCAFIEYKFANNQNYILVLYNLKMRFLSYDSGGTFGWVLSGGVPYEVTTPYTLAESKEIAFRKSYTQNFDVMIITHEDHEPRKLVRLAANSFTFLKYARFADPFVLTRQATKVITAVSQATNATVTAVAHGYAVGDRVKIDGIVGMTELNGWTAAILTVPTADTFTIDVDTTTYTAYASGGTAAKVLTGDYPSVALFYKGRLCYAASRLKITKVWMSESGFYYVHVLPATVTDASALEFVIAEIAQRIEWLYPGSNSLIAGAADGICAINGGGVGNAITSATVEANITPADGCNGAEPLRKDGFIFYVGANGRNVYYFNYDILTEEFVAEDANFISYDVSLGGFTKIRYTKDKNNLIHCLRGDGDLCTVNFNATEKIVGWHEHSTEGTFKDIAQISNNSGAPKLFALVLRNSVYYIERQADYVEFVYKKDFFTDDKPEDEEAYNRYVAEQLKSCIYLDNSTVFSDLRTATLTYSSGAGTITAGVASFVSGDVGKHIAYKTLTGYESGRFLITGYTSTTVVSVTVLQEPTANSYASWYLSFNQLTGISRFNSIEVSVVTDGGFLDDFTPAGGVLDLDDQVTHAVIGYKYRGLIKSFPMGFAVKSGDNTQTTMKAISRVGVRAVNSVGGKFGSSPYTLEPVQELSQNDLNYLPPLPIDGTKYLSYVDDNELDKCFYIVQDEPGPFQTSVVMIDASYAVTR